MLVCWSLTSSLCYGFDVFQCYAILFCVEHYASSSTIFDKKIFHFCLQEILTVDSSGMHDNIFSIF